MPAVTLDRIPELHPDADVGDGKGVWHENAEARSLRRAMTADELEDHRTYDRSLYRARQRSQDDLRRIYGDVWMLVPKRENRQRAWIPERILAGKAVA
jgi:hypothetical protein